MIQEKSHLELVEKIVHVQVARGVKDAVEAAKVVLVIYLSVNINA